MGGMKNFLYGFLDEVEAEGEVLPGGTVELLNSTSDSPPRSDEKVCNHNWQGYTGLIESYQYCTKCDDKRPNE